MLEGEQTTKPPELPIPKLAIEVERQKREIHIGEVLDLASSATGLLRCGFSQVAFGSNQLKMLGVVFAQGEGGQRAWYHIPISRVAEAIRDEAMGIEERIVEYSSGNSQRQGRVRVTRGGRTWEMPAIHWNMMVAHVEAARLGINALSCGRESQYRVRTLWDPSDATTAQIKQIYPSPQRQ